MTWAARLQKELQEMRNNQPPLCSAGPLKGNMSEWQGQIQGPEGSPYKGGIFKLQIVFPATFPRVPPQVKMLTIIYHPNITERGLICLDILKDKWKPEITVGHLLQAICALLGKPNPNDPLERVKAVMYQTNRAEYNRIAESWTKTYAN